MKARLVPFLRVVVMGHASWKIHPVALLQLPVSSIDTRTVGSLIEAMTCAISWPIDDIQCRMILNREHDSHREQSSISSGNWYNFLQNMKLIYILD
jgi:hypothetical protein